MNGRCSGHAAPRLGNRLHHDRRFGYAKAGATDAFGHRDPEPSGLRHRRMKIRRVNAFAIPLQPIIVGKCCAMAQHGFADVLLILG